MIAKKLNINIEKNNKPFQRSDLDKDFIVEINQNNLYFNNSAIYFEHNIYSFVLFDNLVYSTCFHSIY